MSVCGSPLPGMLTTDLHFSETAPVLPTDISEGRLETLSRQAFVLEFAANSMLGAYSSSDMRADLWIAHQSPLLARYYQGLIPEQHAAVAETRVMMAPEFNRRMDDGKVSEVDYSGILWGLLELEDPLLAQRVEDTVAAFHEAVDPREVPGYLSAGNNASVFILEGIAEAGGDGVLKIGHQIRHEESGCDWSAYTNLRRWLGLMAGKDVEGFEQPIAFSAEGPVSVTKLVSGMELLEISKLKNKPQPSEQALQRFAGAVYESIVRRLTIDISGRDLLYDPDMDELTIIDHSASSRAYTRIALSYAETVEAIVDTFNASFGYEFDENAFGRLLDEFSKQGLHDLRARTQEDLA